MQLKHPKRARIGASLCLMTANLLSSNAAFGQAMTDSTNNPLVTEPQKRLNAYDEPAEELGTIIVDSALVYYQESNGRVRAVEPMVSVTHTSSSGNVFSAKVTYDSLTGATPNGATPWTGSQTFVTPADAASIERGGDDDDDDHDDDDDGIGSGAGGTHGSTGASGNLVLNSLTGVYERQYTTPANALPVDSAFRDRRVAVDLGYMFAVAEATKLSLGLNGSYEQDFRSYAGRISVARELNSKATTLSLGLNFEHDQSKPFHGIPVPFSRMSGVIGAGTSETKNVLSLIAGATQVLTPNLLVQLNYSFGKSSGYQTDPYKILSVLDPVSGAPLRYLYESRPDSRTRHSAYAAAKLATGSFVTDISGRYYHDNWGVNSYTIEIAEHMPVGASAYIEPRIRYYHQSAADFFSYYLPSDAALPAFASADSRLDSFNALTFGISGAVQITPGVEIYANAERYTQKKAGGYGALPTGLTGLKLFGGANAMSGLLGVKIKY